MQDLTPLLLPVENLPAVEQSPDATDGKLLARAWAGKAEYLVTGDKSDLLRLAKFKQTRIVTARRFCQILRLLP